MWFIQNLIIWFTIYKLWWNIIYNIIYVFLTNIGHNMCFFTIYKLCWNIIYNIIYVFLTNIGHNMCCFTIYKLWWNIIYNTIYVFLTNIGHNMCCFWDNSLHWTSRTLKLLLMWLNKIWPFCTLKMTFRTIQTNPYCYSTVGKFIPNKRRKHYAFCFVFRIR